MDVVQLLADLVAIPSVNPMGEDVQGAEFFEYRMTDYLEQFFADLKVRFTRLTVEPTRDNEPKRDNIVAVLDGDPACQALVLLEAHQDTVPVKGMTIAPWNPVVRDGRLYGRGSCDVKGGMAAMLTSFAQLCRERPPGIPTLVMACTVDEEAGDRGAAALAPLWSGNDALLERKPDMAIIAEPTSLDIVVAHKGSVRWYCHTKGRAAHSSKPELGDNAIYKMGTVLTLLDRYARDVVPALANHPLCGRPAFTVGTIHGGASYNTVPDQCTIAIDRRVVPGEDPLAAWQHAIDYLRESDRIDFDVQHDEPFNVGMPLLNEQNQVLAGRLQAVARRLAGGGALVGAPYGTDAGRIASFGIPSVVFGPGSVEDVHTVDESIPLAELKLANEILYEFIRTSF